MRILFLTPTLPYPLDNGSRILVFNTIKHLAKKHQIFLLSLIQEGQLKQASYLKDYCVGMETVLTAGLGLWGKDVSYCKKGLAKNFFSPIPYNMIRWYSREMEKKLKEILSRNRFDMVQIENLHMAQYAKSVRGIPVILRQHNMESVLMERYYKFASNPLERAYAFLQWRKLLRYERIMCSNSDLVITLSKVDENGIKRLSSKINTGVLPCGVDLEYFKYSFRARKKDEILYIGNLSFPPVFESIFYFLKQTWPQIKKNYPSAKFLILGNCPPAKSKRIQKFPDVIFIGDVEDVRPYLATSALTVVPHRIASGVRLKILEAMAMRLPVVSTSIGCEGIEVADEEHILIADTPESFAKKVMALLESNNLRTKLTEQAYALVQERYTWENADRQLNQIYERLQGKFNSNKIIDITESIK